MHVNYEKTMIFCLLLISDNYNHGYRQIEMQAMSKWDKKEHVIIHILNLMSLYFTVAPKINLYDLVYCITVDCTS